MLYDINIDFGGINFPLPYKKPHTIYIGFVSVYSGCNRALNGKPCPNCQNPFLWAHDVTSSNKKHDLTPSAVYSFVEKKMAKFKGLYSNHGIQYYHTILGGEPLDQKVATLEEVQYNILKGIIDSDSMLSRADIPTILFSGYDNMKKVPLDMKNYVLNHVTYLKLGRFLGNKHIKPDLPSGLATENQRWISVSEVDLKELDLL